MKKINAIISTLYADSTTMRMKLFNLEGRVSNLADKQEYLDYLSENISESLSTISYCMTPESNLFRGMGEQLTIRLMEELKVLERDFSYMLHKVESLQTVN